MACSTQWRSAGRAIVGLDYTPLFRIMDGYGITDQMKVLVDVQVIEARAVELFTEKARKANQNGA
jgi:hypothetical protein